MAFTSDKSARWKNFLSSLTFPAAKHQCSVWMVLYGWDVCVGGVSFCVCVWRWQVPAQGHW